MTQAFVDNLANEGSPCIVREGAAMRPSLITSLGIAILVFVAGAICALASASTIGGTIVVTTMLVIAYIHATILAWVISRREKAMLIPAVAMTVTAGAWVVLVAIDVSFMIFSGGPTTLVDQRRWTHTLVETILMCLPLTCVAIVATSAPTCDDNSDDED